jgi:hypothetical protein
MSEGGILLLEGYQAISVPVSDKDRTKTKTLVLSVVKDLDRDSGVLVFYLLNDV